MRKTRSSDCVLLPPLIQEHFDGRCMEGNTFMDASQGRKASRYSFASQRVNYLPSTPECPCDETCMNLSTSSSHSYLDVNDTNVNNRSNGAVTNILRVKSHVTSSNAFKCLILLLFICVDVAEKRFSNQLAPYVAKQRLSSPATEPILSAPKLFISIDIIERMTLSDIALTFEFVLKSGNDDFELSKFLIKGDAGKPLSEEMTIVIKTIIDVTTKSRGEGVLPSRTQQQPDVKSFGNIDALKFCAAMRIFAEWRVVRQVPPGYKGYAFGMDLGRKDVIENISKIETATYTWINMKLDDHVRKYVSSGVESGRQICASNSNREKTMCLDDQMIVRSPTLRDLLSHEKNTDYHDRLPRLKEKSAAMGLLWARRQFQYQTSTFENVLMVPKMFPTAIDAVTEAYSEVYGKFHGWAIRKVFECSFRAAPDLMAVYRHMNPLYLKTSLEEIKRETQSPATNSDNVDNVCTITENKGISKNISFPKDKSQSNKNPFQAVLVHISTEWNKLFNHIQNEVDKFGKQVGGEWDKVTSSIINTFQRNKKLDNGEINSMDKEHIQSDTENIVDSEKKSFHTDLKCGVLLSNEMELILNKRMQKDAEDRIMIYLNVVNPILLDLSWLFSELNMDDPTKV